MSFVCEGSDSMNYFKLNALNSTPFFRKFAPLYCSNLVNCQSKWKKMLMCAFNLISEKCIKSLNFFIYKLLQYFLLMREFCQVLLSHDDDQSQKFHTIIFCANEFASFSSLYAHFSQSSNAMTKLKTFPFSTFFSDHSKSIFLSIKIS